VTDSNNIHLLKENLDAMDSAISWLKRSVGICNQIGIKADYAVRYVNMSDT